jgi:hypothetical protein
MVMIIIVLFITMSFIYEYTIDITVNLFIKPIIDAKLITYSREARNNKFVISSLIPYENKSCNVYEILWTYS